MARLNCLVKNVPVVQEMEEAGRLEISGADAQARSMVDGDVVRAGVVSARLHWAKLSSENSNINVLTSENLTDLGNSATFYSVLVEVELFKPSPRYGGGLDGLHGSTV